MDSVSIIIPVYNSENTIRTLVDELVIKLSYKYILEVILVNDCSSDNSENVCIDLHKKYKNMVSFYSLSKNVGEHNAVMAGLNNVSGEYVVIMDDDFQNPVTEVIKLVTYAVKSKYDVVYTYYTKKKHSIFRNIGSWFNDKIANLVLKKQKNLYLSSFKIIHIFIVKEIIKYDLPFPYLDGLILRTTENIGTIEVKHQERYTGKSGYTFNKLFSLWLNMFTNFSILPLRLSIILGIVFAFVGFIIGIHTIYEKFINPDIPLGYATIIVVFTMFAGIQLVAIGVLGEYLGRVYLSINKQPQYLIRKKLIKK